MLLSEQSPGTAIYGGGCTGSGEVELFFPEMSLGVPCALHR